MRHSIHRFFFGVAVLCAGLQFVGRPGTTSSPAEINMDRLHPLPPQVQTVIKRSCKDCHSAETAWPWYSRIAPLSWIIARDVRQGRKHLDFTEIGSSAKGPSANEAEDICDAVTRNTMPPAPYRFMHRNAQLSSADVAVFCNWADELVTRNATSR